MISATMWNHKFNSHWKRTALRCLVLGAASSTLSLWACSVPVFRYALEHWPADLYQAVVFHRGELSAAEQSLVQQFNGEGESGRTPANISARAIDLDQNSAPEVLDFWRQLGAETMPWVVVRYPLTTGLPGNIWSGPLTEPAIRRIFDSPLRDNIATRLGSGESAVWVILEVGDKAKDAAAAEMLETRLAYLATVLELPKLEAQDIANGLVSVGQEDLKLRFSVLRLSRHDPDEQIFIKTLLGTEADLAEIQEPIVFPIFGRGRALYALVGKGINHETIDEAATFLIGKCSCQVKELNPGVDLLVSANWETLMKTGDAPAQESPPVIDLAESVPVTVTISGETDDATAAKSAGGSAPKWVMPVAASLALAALIATGFLWFRKQ